MRITNRSMAASFAFALAFVLVKHAVPPSPAQSAGGSAVSAVIAFSVLAVSLAAAYWMSKRATHRSVTFRSSVWFGFLAAVPYAVATYGAVTGWIRIFGRAGRFADYSVAASPVGFWSTFMIYVALATIPLSWALTYLWPRREEKVKP